MKHRKAAAVLCGLAVLLLLGFGTLKYKTDYARREILRSFPDDKSYSLTVYTVGEPDFPFGASHCLFVLKRDGKKISSCNFDVLNDGGSALPEDFEIFWLTNGVRIVVSGDEQENKEYLLNFDGTVITG